MKKIVTVLLSVVMLLSFGLTAYGAETTTADFNKSAVTLESNSVLSPNAWYYSYTKTITKNYTVLEDIPDSIYYSEYNSGMGVTCTGYLDLQSITVTRTNYSVTFSGTIGAYIY